MPRAEAERVAPKERYPDPIRVKARGMLVRSLLRAAGPGRAAKPSAETEKEKEKEKEKEGTAGGEEEEGEEEEKDDGQEEEEEREPISRDEAMELAREIETAVWKRSERLTHKPYRAHCRRLCFSLARNASLVLRVASGRVRLDELVRLEALELANTETRAAIAKAKEDALESVRVPRREMTKTDMYICGDCSSRECEYMIIFEGGDISKSDTWGHKDDASIICAVHCLTCDKEWEVTSG